MQPSTAFIAGIGFTLVGGYVVLKVLKPTIVAKISDVGAREIVRFAQARGIPLDAITGQTSYSYIRTQFLDNTVSQALSEVGI
jgi:hypothetical protein